MQHAFALTRLFRLEDARQNGPTIVLLSGQLDDYQFAGLNAMTNHKRDAAARDVARPRRLGRCLGTIGIEERGRGSARVSDPDSSFLDGSSRFLLAPKPSVE